MAGLPGDIAQYVPALMQGATINIGNTVAGTVSKTPAYITGSVPAANSQNPGILITGTDTGAANAYVTTPVPAPAYATGQMYSFSPANTNTGASTLAIGSQSAKNITKNGATALSPGDLVAGTEALVIYDGTEFQLINPQSGGLSVTFNLSSANILAMNGTPVTILAAAGTGKTILVDSLDFYMTTTSTQYANGGTIQLQYHGASTNLLATTIAAAVVTTTAGTSLTSVTRATSITGSSNTAIDITNGTAPFITGTGTAVLIMRYRLVNF